MTTTLIILAILLWLACPALCYGMTYAHFQRGFPSLAEERRVDDKVFAFSMASVALFLGPIVTIPIFFISGKAKHGLKFR